MTTDDTQPAADFALFGRDLFGNPITPDGLGPLAKRFILPPFSVLDARSGDWRERKQAWIGRGLRSELGRKVSAYAVGEWMEDAGGGSRGNVEGVSIFDPVLCELAMTWWCPPGGTVIDPFAGGSVRGIVAGALGNRYHGRDLRAAQVEANKAQAVELQVMLKVPPTWDAGDSRVGSDPPPADMLFTCPPYGDLEVYSDDPADISGMSYDQFMLALGQILKRWCAAVKPDGYAVVVVGDFRNKRTGHLRGFPAELVTTMRMLGWPLYNEAVLVTATGTLPVRVAAHFDKSRKLGMGHQHVLVFRR